MKKLILFVFLLTMGIGAMAQSVQLYTFTADTLSNGDTAYCTLPILHADWDFSYVITLDELSGTATLTTEVEVSNNGTVWAIDDTFVGGSYTEDEIFTYKGNAYGRYYRLQIIQTGTATTSVFGTAIIKKSVVIAQ